MQYKVFTASGLVHTGNCEFYGYTISSHTAGTIKVIDGLTAGSGRVIMDTTTLSTDTVPMTIKLPASASCVTGLYVVIGGAASVTMHWN